jgi:hypothetical protein
MIYALPGASFEATAQMGTTGLGPAGAITVAVYDNIGGTTIPPTSAGIIEVAPGVYAATLTAPLQAGQYVVVWDDGSSSRAAEDLYITTSQAIPLTPTAAPGMDVGELLDQILLDRFETEHRPRALLALNNRYAQLWGIEDWTWRFAKVPVSVSVGVSFVGGLPNDFGVPLYFWDPDGKELSYLDTSYFQSAYATSTPGTPAAWTVIDQQIYLGPTPDTSSSAYQTYYRRRLIQLTDETQIPDFPQEFQLALVHGARAELLAFYNDPTAPVMDAEFQKDIEALRREYLSDATGEPAMWPSDGLSSASGGW